MSLLPSRPWPPSLSSVLTALVDFAALLISFDPTPRFGHPAVLCVSVEKWCSCYTRWRVLCQLSHGN